MRELISNGTLNMPGFKYHFSSDQIDAIVAYLRTVPAVSNRVPRPRYTWAPAYLWGKFKLLILGDDPPLFIYTGNAGTAGGRS